MFRRIYFYEREGRIFEYEIKHRLSTENIAMFCRVRNKDYRKEEVIRGFITISRGAQRRKDPNLN